MASINTFELNNAPINGLGTTGTGSGELVSVAQIVGRTGSGELVSIEQDVRLRATGSGELVSIEQNVVNTQSGELVSIEQKVRASLDTSHLNRTGWDLTLNIGGELIPANQIHGRLNVRRTENSASLMDVTLIPPAGIQQAQEYIGKTVTLDVETTDGGVKRVYTGIVDIPEIDVIDKKITLRCTDRRTELINSQISPILATIGSYSSIIFPNKPKDAAQELEFRLSTTPTAVDFDAYGNINITDWAAKTTPDFILDDPDVYRRAPKIDLTSRGRIVNKVNVKFQYRYERLHQWERDYQWESPIDSLFCLFLYSGYDLTRRDLIVGAIQGAGWPVKGNVTFNPLPPIGWYNCFGIGGGVVAFNAFRNSFINIPALDSEGNPITDASGSQSFEQQVVGGTSAREIFTTGATWTASTRWAQTVTEEFSLSVQAPKSQDQYGTVENSQNFSSSSDFDVSNWEDYSSHSEITGFSEDYFIDQDLDRTNATNAINIALLRAKNTILNSHRDTRVSIFRSIWPEIDLKHTVQLTTDPIQCKGKVLSINHVFDMSTTEAFTEVTLVLSTSTAVQSESGLVAPVFDADSVTLPTGTITLGNHFGINPDPTVTQGAELWTGFVGNLVFLDTFIKTSYTQQFVVDTPGIPEEHRQERIRTIGGSYNVNIPDDNLIITF